MNGVALRSVRGESRGVVGESGCDKSTLDRLVTRLHEPTAGTVRFEGRDITRASAAEMRPLRPRLQMVFQDPYASLNPRMRVRDILAEPLLAHGRAAARAEADSRVLDLMATVGLKPDGRALPGDSPAASASAFPSHAPSRWTRRWWWRTSRSRRST